MISSSPLISQLPDRKPHAQNDGFKLRSNATSSHIYGLRTNQHLNQKPESWIDATWNRVQEIQNASCLGTLLHCLFLFLTISILFVIQKHEWRFPPHWPKSWHLMMCEKGVSIPATGLPFYPHRLWLDFFVLYKQLRMEVILSLCIRNVNSWGVRLKETTIM